MSKKYVTVYQELKNAIAAGTYRHGDKLPAEQELTAQYGVSRQTVRQSMELLRREGLIRSSRGSGTYVHITPPQLNTRRIAVITYSITQSDFPAILSGIEAHLSANGYTTTLYATHDSVMVERQILTKLCQDPVDGVLLCAVESTLGCANLDLIRRLRHMGTQFLFFGIRYPDPELADIPSVTMDDYEGVYRIVDDLLQQGHRRVGGFFNLSTTHHAQRMRAVRQAILDRGLEYDYRLFWYQNDVKSALTDAETNIRNVAQAGVRALQDQCDLMICTSGMFAPEVVQELSNWESRTVRTLVIFDDAALPAVEGMQVLIYQGATVAYGEECAAKLLRLIDGQPEASYTFAWVAK